ncbi:MAG: hypothetical protein Ct9H300mP7_4830 [Verrucomicrobiota bacterium]|nr:MAG: hypothetical protein Ct9H300mP7_4830 [Verrucomicrobiota bacterium]
MFNTVPAHGNVKCLQVKSRFHTAKRLPNQQSQRALRTFVIVAEMLLLLDLGKDAFYWGVSSLMRIPISWAFITILLRPARSLTRIRRLLPTAFGVCMFETLRHLLNGIHMHPPLCAKQFHQPTAGGDLASDWLFIHEAGQFPQLPILAFGSVAWPS